MSHSDRRFVRLLATYALLLLGLHLVVDWLPATWAGFWYPASLIGPGGRLDPAEWLWGVFPASYVPVWFDGC